MWCNACPSKLGQGSALCADRPARGGTWQHIARAEQNHRSRVYVTFLLAKEEAVEQIGPEYKVNHPPPPPPPLREQYEVLFPNSVVLFCGCP